MLGKELLAYRVRAGAVRPTFVDVDDGELVRTARELVEAVEANVGASRGDLEEELATLASASRRAKLARGLAKLLADRVVFEEPSEEGAAFRAALFRRAAILRRDLEEGASLESYETRLALAMGRDLESMREDLHADLPSRRRVIGFDAIDARSLLERYNMALVQGLVLYAASVVVEIDGGEVVSLRRILRHMKWSRLVARVDRVEDRYRLEVEGPAAILSMQKSYGLQLANFVLAVPLLDRFVLRARVSLPGRSEAMLEIDETAPLGTPLAQGLGYVPEEVASLARSFVDDEWTVDASPEPRHIGASNMCMPDLVLRHAVHGEVAVELFHAFHDSALARRLADLETRPDPRLVLGVQRALLKRVGLAARDSLPRGMFSFDKFPSERSLRKILEGVAGEASRR